MRAARDRVCLQLSAHVGPRAGEVTVLLRNAGRADVCLPKGRLRLVLRKFDIAL